MKLQFDFSRSSRYLIYSHSLWISVNLHVALTTKTYLVRHCVCSHTHGVTILMRAHARGTKLSLHVGVQLVKKRTQGKKSEDRMALCVESHDFPAMPVVYAFLKHTHIYMHSLYS